MERKVMLIPVGEQIAPLLYGLKCFKEIDEVFLIYTSKTETQSKKLENYLRKYFFIKNIKKVKCDAEKLPSILQVLLNEFSSYPLESLKIISNVSGGTKMMAMACYLFSSFFDGLSFYIFKKDDEMKYVEVPTIRVSVWEELHPLRKRHKILELLEKKESTLTELSEQLKVKESTTTYYLKDMIEKGWVRRKGRRYEITEFGKLSKCLAKLMEEKRLS